MSIHTAIKEFTEKYDTEAITSIERLPAKVGLCADVIPFNAFVLKESCDSFVSYLRGYSDYMKMHKDNPNKSTRENIKASMENYMADPEIFKECTIRYKAIPEFVKSYLESVQNIITTVDTIKEEMELDGVDLEYVGDVNEYAELFLNKLNEKFDPVMNNILWASGYAATHKKSPDSLHKVTFL